MTNCFNPNYASVDPNYAEFGGSFAVGDTINCTRLVRRCAEGVPEPR